MILQEVQRKINQFPTVWPEKVCNFWREESELIKLYQKLTIFHLICKYDHSEQFLSDLTPSNLINLIKTDCIFLFENYLYLKSIAVQGREIKHLTK